MRRCEADNVRARRIDVDYASHSAQVDAIREPLAEALAGIEPRSSSVAFFSTVTGELDRHRGLGRRLLVPKHPADRAIRTGGAQRVRSRISGVHRVQSASGADRRHRGDPGRPDPGAEPIVIPSLGRDDGGLDRFWLSVGQAHVAGVAVDWRAVFARGGRRVELPTYAFQRRRFWLPPLALASGDLGGLGLAGAEHGLAGRGGGAARFRWGGADRPAVGGAQPWLADHAVAGVVLFPGAGFVELALRAGDEVGCAVVEELTLSAPLLLPAADGVQVQVVVGAADELRSPASVGVFAWQLSLIRSGCCTPRAR